jgi:hypothetical protein
MFGVGVDPDSDPKILSVADIIWGRERDASHAFQLKAKIKALRMYLHVPHILVSLPS